MGDSRVKMIGQREFTVNGYWNIVNHLSAATSDRYILADFWWKRDDARPSLVR